MYHKIRKFISAFLLLSLGFYAKTQALQRSIWDTLDSLLYRNWTIKDGLPVNSLNLITKDDNGYLWFSTYDGLVRFDGLNFRVFNYSNTPSLRQNRTTIIYFQKEVGLWIALENGGVALKKNDIFFHYDAQNGFTNADISDIFEIDNVMYFITTEGLYVFEKGAFRLYYATENTLEQPVTKYYFDAENRNLWFVTSAGLIRLHNNEKKRFELKDKSGKSIISNVNKDVDNKIIVGTEKGVYEVAGDLLVPSKVYLSLRDVPIMNLYNDERFTLVSTMNGVYQRKSDRVVKLRVNQEEKFKDKYIFRFFRDHLGVVWLVTNYDNVYTFNGSEILEAGFQIEFPEARVRYLYEDEENSLWLATAESGLYRISKSKIKVLGKNEGLSADNMLGILKDSKGRYWLSTRNYGVNIVENDNKISHLDFYNGLVTGLVYTIAEDSSGAIWLGHNRRGLDRWIDGNIEHFDLSKDIDENDVHALFVSKDKQIWAGTYGGLVRFDENFSTIIRYLHKDGLSGIKIRNIAEDSEGGIWTASLDGGVSRLKNGIFTNYTSETGLSSDNTRSLYIDSDNVVWVGTETNGLNRIKKDEITFITTKDGLPDHIIHWITEDEYGFLWLLSNKGVFRIEKSELNDYLDGNKNEKVRIAHFAESDGMRSPEGNGAFQSAGLKTNDGKIWFSTQKGVAIFDLAMIQQGAPLPILHIENIVSDEAVFKPDSLNRVILPKGTRSFTVHFNAASFSSPERVRLRYKLDGVGTTWIETSNRAVTFNDVSPGKYRFILDGTNYVGTWGESVLELNIEIPKKFYQTNWFYLLIILLAIAVYYIGVRISIRLLIHRQKRMQALIDKQTQELQQERDKLSKRNIFIEKQAEHLREAVNTKDKFLSIIAHDLRNPFQTILGYAEIISKDFEMDLNESELRTGISAIKSSAELAYNLLENLLTWALLQNGQLIPTPVHISLPDIIAPNIELAKQAALQKEIEISVSTHQEGWVFADKNMVDTVVRNLLSNAVKFTNFGGKIMVQTGIKNKDCFFVVQDNGIGMSQDYMNRITQLESNFTREGTNNEKGSGLGLLLCNEMVVKNNGRMEIESQINVGTKITIYLPKAQKAKE